MSDNDKLPGSGAPSDRPAPGPRPTPVRTSMREPLAPMPDAAADERTIFQPVGRSRSAAPKTPPAAPSESSHPPGRGSADPPLTGMPAAGGPEDHTIIRPNPGGRRPMPARDPAAPAPQILTPAAPRRAAVEEAEIGVVNAEPIMRAAGPLLLLLGRLRTTLLRAHVQALVPQLIEAVQKFESELLGAGFSPDVAKQAKYILCATADEVIANLPGGDRVAAQASVTSRFFGEGSSAERFFDDAAAGKAQPSVLYALLQLQHACLALGFAGHSRTFATEPAALPRFQHAVYEKIARARPRGFQRLSPRWQGQAMPAPAVQLRVPFWAIAGIVGLALCVLYLTLRTLLALQAEHVAATLASFNPPKPVAIARHTAEPPPPPAPPTATQTAQLARIRKILAPNIDAGTLALAPTANQIIIRIADSSVFQPGKAAVLSSFRTLALYIALALNGEKGPIKVLVHTDNRPVSNDRYGSNFDLSAARARAVGAVLKDLLTQPERITAEGKGADVPVASNDTAEGRAKNRRVEIVLDRSD